MKQNSGNIHPMARATAVLCLMFLFLIFSFCPLRNTLFKLLQPEPVKTAQPAPEYAKVNAGQTCSTAILLKAKIPTEKVFDPSFRCKAFLNGSFYQLTRGPVFTTCTLSLAYVANFQHSTTIYLRNCAFLI